MEVKWLTRVLQNLDAEVTYIAQDNRAAARRIAQRIVDAINLLPDNPALGRPGRVPGMRELVVADTHYLVPYRVRPRLQQVEVLRVFHTSRSLPAHW